jgi:hypothetical protein
MGRHHHDDSPAFEHDRVFYLDRTSYTARPWRSRRRGAGRRGGRGPPDPRCLPIGTVRARRTRSGAHISAGGPGSDGPAARCAGRRTRRSSSGAVRRPGARRHTAAGEDGDGGRVVVVGQQDRLRGRVRPQPVHRLDQCSDIGSRLALAIGSVRPGSTRPGSLRQDHGRRTTAWSSRSRRARTSRRHGAPEPFVEAGGQSGSASSLDRPARAASTSPRRQKAGARPQCRPGPAGPRASSARSAPPLDERSARGIARGGVSPTGARTSHRWAVEREGAHAVSAEAEIRAPADRAASWPDAREGAEDGPQRRAGTHASRRRRPRRPWPPRGHTPAAATTGAGRTRCRARRRARRSRRRSTRQRPRRASRLPHRPAMGKAARRAGRPAASGSGSAIRSRDGDGEPGTSRHRAPRARRQEPGRRRRTIPRPTPPPPRSVVGASTRTPYGRARAATQNPTASNAKRNREPEGGATARAPLAPGGGQRGQDEQVPPPGHIPGRAGDARGKAQESAGVRRSRRTAGSPRRWRRIRREDRRRNEPAGDRAGRRRLPASPPDPRRAPA